MHNLKAGIQNELILRLYRRKTVAFMAASALIPVLLGLSLHSLQPILGLATVSRSFPIDMLGLFTAVWIPLFICLTAADLFPGEVAARTLKLALLRPISRFHVYASKTAALIVGIAGLLLLLGASTTGCSLFLGGAGSFHMAETVKAYAASFVAMTCPAAMLVWVAQFFGCASGSFAFSVVLYIAAKLAPFFARPASAFSPAAYTDWHLLWIGGSASAGRLASTALFLVSAAVLFFLLGYFMFNRKDA